MGGGGGGGVARDIVKCIKYFLYYEYLAFPMNVGLLHSGYYY